MALNKVRYVDQQDSISTEMEFVAKLLEVCLYRQLSNLMIDLAYLLTKSDLFLTDKVAVIPLSSFCQH